MSITKINGKHYQELDTPALKITIRDRLDVINDEIENEKTRRDVHVSNIQKLQLEKDTLKANLIELNK